LGYEIVIIAALAALAVSVLVGVGFLLLGRRTPTTEDTADVNELAHELVSLKKQVRRAYMQRVRAGEVAPEQSTAEPVEAPPQLQSGAEPSPSSPDSRQSAKTLKDRLRAAVFSSPGRRPLQ
jgi:hypothetical protein